MSEETIACDHCQCVHARQHPSCCVGADQYIDRLRAENAALSASEERVKAEHELYLKAHRDNMKAALIMADLRARVRVMREACIEVLSDLEGGFVRCQRCGDQEDTATMDCVRILLRALAAHPAEQEKKR